MEILWASAPQGCLVSPGVGMGGFCPQQPVILCKALEVPLHRAAFLSLEQQEWEAISNSGPQSEVSDATLCWIISLNRGNAVFTSGIHVGTSVLCWEWKWLSSEDPPRKAPLQSVIFMCVPWPWGFQRFVCLVICLLETMSRRHSWLVVSSSCCIICLKIYHVDNVEYLPHTTRRSNQSILKEISLEYSLEGLMLKLKLLILWPPDSKNWLIGKDPGAGKDWRREEKGTTEDEMVGWHHWLDGYEFE